MKKSITGNPLTQGTHHQHDLLLLRLFVGLVLVGGPASGQTTTGTASPSDHHVSTHKYNQTMVIIMVILVASFFLMGFFSVYVRHCTDRLQGHDPTPPSVGHFAFGRRSLRVAGRGLDPSVVESFPSFFYGSVKCHKVNKSASLECAVCLNEFEDEETLRLIPQCCHVFHTACIDSWLSSHTTCPVCRADLTPKPGEVVVLQMSPEDKPPSEDEEITRDHESEGPRLGLPRRSRSTGMRLASMLNYFPRSQSTGQRVARGGGEDRERFTLRLPEEVMRDESIMRSRAAFSRELGETSSDRLRPNHMVDGPTPRLS